MSYVPGIYKLLGFSPFLIGIGQGWALLEFINKATLDIIGHVQGSQLLF